MLQIGEFARLSHISVRMLRHYDQEGLLKPAQQDRVTGYRSYAVGQLAAANRITTLRDLGFPIRDIKRLAEADDDALLAALDGRGEELEEGIKREQRKLAALHRFRQEVESGSSEQSFEVSLVSVPSYEVVALRMALESYDQERLAWERLGAFVKERGIKPSDPYTEYCEFPDEGGVAEAFAGGGPELYQEKEPMVPDGDGAAGSASRPGEPSCVVEVAVATEAQGRDEGPFRFFRSAPLPLAASIKVYGPFENIAPVYESFARWLESHPSLRMDGPTREVAHRGPWNTDDPQDYLTELLVPVVELD